MKFSDTALPPFLQKKNGLTVSWQCAAGDGINTCDAAAQGRSIEESSIGNFGVVSIANSSWLIRFRNAVWQIH